MLKSIKGARLTLTKAAESGCVFTYAAHTLLRRSALGHHFSQLWKKLTQSCLMPICRS